ncbi:MAG TPA: alpha/beta fold hydrolase [Blastococcus sp.]|nr:alpha/beta fold hydrolase [Blastococcus sp.]
MLRHPRRAPGVLAGTLAAGLLLGACGSEVRGSLRAPEDPVGTVLAQRSCPDSGFRCITLAVPADHFAKRSPLWEATFALHRGTVDSRGVLVTATGGPGSSGIASADDEMSTMPKEITDHCGLVFFDQRGIGLSHPCRCDEAMDSDDAPSIDATADAGARDVYAAATQAFVHACFTEAHVPTSDARLYATRQGAEDLEVFRRWLGADSLILYGESYGTQYQQTYAAAHPDHVAELLLDGPVDPGTDVRQFGPESATAYSDVLAATLTACDRDTVCGGDVPGTTKTAYDTLAAELAAHPRDYDYPEPDGSREKRQLTVDDLRSAASGTRSARGTP